MRDDEIDDDLDDLDLDDLEDDEEDDTHRHVLPDGARVRVPISMMDSTQRCVAMNRPGFKTNDDVRARVAFRETLHRLPIAHVYSL